MIAIISDIHGNYEALKRVLEKIDEMDISEIFCLGDVVGYYSEINECCKELRERKVKCVMGNHDWYMVSGTNCKRSHSVNDCLKYQRKIILLENIEWLSTLPVIMHYEGLSMVHGGWNNPIDEYIEPVCEYFIGLNGNYFVSGHSHIQCIYKHDGLTYCNPGSVGQPRDGDNRAAFVTFDGEEFVMHRVVYDIDTVGEKMKQIGFGEYYYGCLRNASKCLHK